MATEIEDNLEKIVDNLEEVIINRVYSGNCNENYLGHEAINLIQSDNYHNYVYMLANGDYASKHFEKRRVIILTRGINRYRAQVLGVLTGITSVFEDNVNTLVEKGVVDTNGNTYHPLKNIDDYTIIAGVNREEELTNNEKSDRKLIRNGINELQKKYIKENKIKYRSVPLDRIFADSKRDKDGLSIYITFEATKFYKPKFENGLYLVSNKSAENCVREEVVNNINLAPRKISTIIDKEDNEEVFQSILKILRKSDLWEVDTSDRTLKDISKISFLEIMGKEYSEIAFSNMLTYFLRKYQKLYYSFFYFLGSFNEGIKNYKPSKLYTIVREKENNIDIYIRDGNCEIVIENKLKSKIHGKQLEKYYGHIKDKGFYFILEPTYNHISIEDNLMKEKYKKISYSYIHNFFSINKSLIEDRDDKNYYEEFLKGLEIQCKPIDEHNFDIMKRKLDAAINKANKQ